MVIETTNIILSTVSAVSAVVVAVVACVALRSFRSRKWWERRVDSYLKVLDALADSDAYYNRELSTEFTQSEAPAEQMKDLLEKAWSANQEIRKVIDLAELFISNEAHQRLIQYKKDIARASRNIDNDGYMTSWVDHLSSVLEATRACQTDMIRIAKKDLELP